MTKSIDFYFDFISPYSYLAYQKLKTLNKDNFFKIIYKPILLGGLHNLGGITAPAFNVRKMKNMKDDCRLIADKNKIQFQWNENVPTFLQLKNKSLCIYDYINVISDRPISPHGPWDMSTLPTVISGVRTCCACT